MSGSALFAQSLAGNWQGTLQVPQANRELRTVIKISTTPADTLQAQFYSIDPATGLPPDGLIGFLPPEDGTGRGEGYLSYTIQPKVGLATGTAITNVALVTFDENPAIATDQVDDGDPALGIDSSKEALVTIDSVAPTSSVGP